VHVMDSLALFSKMNQATVLQIARIYSRTVPPSQSFFTIERLSVQQQDGTLDCDLFAVANAVEVHLNSNPVSAQYVQKMRRHLEDCLNDETLHSFPVCSTEPLPRPTCTVHIKLYCICRTPEEYDERICCDSCSQWYHVSSCMKLGQAETSDYWVCCVCKRNVEF